MFKKVFYKKFEASIENPNEIDFLIPKIFQLFKPRTILLLTGEVGAGKTELVKRIAKKMNLSHIESPSFSIHHQYSNDSGKVILDHLDLYRLENDDDLESTGFWDLFSCEQGLVVIEWAERLNWQDLPINWDCIHINITLDKSNGSLSRKFEVFNQYL